MEDPRIISALFIFLKMAYYNVLINKGTKRFSLLDVESLCMMAEDGTKEIGICRFVDEKQVDVNGQVWEIGEFLWQMERRGIQVYPLETAEKKKR